MRERLKATFTADPMPVQFLIGLAYVVIGTSLLLPEDTFRHATSWSLFRNAGISENLLGSFFVAIGIIVLSALLVGGLRVQIYTMLIASIVFWALTLAFVITLLSTTTIYGVLASGALWAYWRLLTRYLKNKTK